MSVSGAKRAERLLALIQILRRHRYPVSGSQLAEELSVSLRTLYRDIDALRSQGADIRGEAGTGYLLDTAYFLPPVMFTPEQLDALALGLRWVSLYGDFSLSQAADEAAGNIFSVLPARLQTLFNHSTLLVGPGDNKERHQEMFVLLRTAIRKGVKIQACYQDISGKKSERILWPFALGYLPEETILAAWCEMRGGFRHFTVTQFSSVQLVNTHYPHSRQSLIKRWRKAGLDKPLKHA